ncbi:hypothetical protein EVAR_64547_1 [Eumeta japonica]|uniref:Reverse transcriptase domain-containing protein n=1 Tax=Eumeta variegata TaxID=151549 RepID=A0A4C1ZQM2_EUMVA|nr:hypothetical protein EVAR_64547_1 [Eumeta japonica]
MFLYADDQVILALSACDLPKVATKMNDPVKKRDAKYNLLLEIESLVLTVDDTVMYEHSRFVVLEACTNSANITPVAL